MMESAIIPEAATEIWKPVKEYENHYEVSSQGKVRSRPRTVTYSNGSTVNYKGKELIPNNVSGYEQVSLSKGGRVCNKYVHQIVAETFLDHVINGYDQVVDHINGIKNDNRADNIRIVSQKENIRNYWKGLADKPKIEVIDIELDEYDSFNIKEMEISYGEDYLVFDLDVYQTVEHFSGTKYAPGGSEVKSTSITVDNLIWYNTDGDVLLMTDEQKFGLEKEITNKIKTW